MEQMAKVTLITRTSNNAQKPRAIAVTMDGRGDHQTGPPLGDPTFHASFHVVDV